MPDAGSLVSEKNPSRNCLINRNRSYSRVPPGGRTVRRSPIWTSGVTKNQGRESPPAVYQTVSEKLSEKSRRCLERGPTDRRKKGLFGPFCRPYTGQINGWRMAQITFRTVSLGRRVNRGGPLLSSWPKL